MRKRWGFAAGLALVVGSSVGAQESVPQLSLPRAPLSMPMAQPGPSDHVLPINLATALRLAEARPIMIQMAELSVQADIARLQQARALWLPTIFIGADYQRHDGGLQVQREGDVIHNHRNQFLVGAGPKAVFALTDAIYRPLAAAQVLQSRQLDVQTARNEALFRMADAYFRVQESRGRLASYDISVSLGQELLQRIDKLGGKILPAVEIDRTRASLAELEQEQVGARRDWRTSSAELSRVLRLPPSSLVVPLEPPHILVNLIPAASSIDELIPIGLVSRPELASQQALVQASLTRLKQERMRPLIPTVVVQGSANPDNRLMGGYYAAGRNDSIDNRTARQDVNVQVLWELRNLGFGNRGLVAERQAEQQLATYEYMRIQDTVSAEIASAHAEVIAAREQLPLAEKGVLAAVASFKGNIQGLNETQRIGEVITTINRPQEVIASLLQLRQAYTFYYRALNNFNRAQFRLFYALGYPAQSLGTNPSFGEPLQ